MPPGGEGYYYFSIYLTVIAVEFAYFDIQINGELLCTATVDNEPSVYSAAVCAGISYILEGV